MSFLESLPTDLKIQVQDVIQSYAPSEEVFRALIEHYTSDDNKRRKHNHVSTSTNSTTTGSDGTFPATLEGCHIILQIPELSIQSPIRKKLNLVFGVLPGERSAFLALTKSIDSPPELIVKDLTPENITFATLLKVPEKKALRTILIMYKSNWDNKYKNDPILIQFNYDSLSEQFGPLLGTSDLATYLKQQCSIVGFSLIDSTSKDNKSFFVESYKGSKEGYLYFLPSHVIFGFKKPILVFQSSHIESITYSSITRLTFNVTLHVRDTNHSDGLVRHEFSMIDQKEYERINAYVKNKEFRDKSMTEELKAKVQLKNPEAPGALAEAAKMVPGGDQIVNEGDSDDEEEDANFQMGEEEELSDGSGESEEEDDDDEEGEEEEEEEEEDESEEENGEEEEEDMQIDEDEELSNSFQVDNDIEVDGFPYSMD